MKILKKIVFSIVGIIFFGLAACSNSNYPSSSIIDDDDLVGAEINVKTSTKQNIEGIGDCYFLYVRNSQVMLKFADYVETNKDATWTVSTDVGAKDQIPSRTVELSEGHPNSNLYFIYVANDAAKAYETYPVLIHRNYMFSVTFNSDGGTACQTQFVEEGYKLNNIPTTSKTGHTFKGWDYDFNNPIRNNVFTNAIWDANQYVISFDPNGGSVEPSKLDVYYGQSAIGLPTPVRKGYVFKGWSYDGHIITENDAYYFDKSITVVAIWEIIVYSITYELDGGQNNSDNPTTFTINDPTIYLKPATKVFYDFVCWEENGNVITEIDTLNPSNHVLKAKYDIHEYTITYVLNGGYNSSKNPSSFTGLTETFTLQDPTYMGMMFLGWFDQDGNKITQIKKGTDKDLVLTAEWDYYFDFNKITGEISNLKKLNYNDVLIPEGVKEIPYAFFYGAQLERIFLPSTLKTINDDAFRASSVRFFELPEGLEKIGDFAFAECSRISENTVIIPSSVNYLGSNIFYCSSVANINIDPTSSYGYNRFGVYYLADYNSQYSIVLGLSHSSPDDYKIVCGDYVIKEGCRIISANSFSEQEELESITIPKTVKYICNSAFQGCISLSTIVFKGTTSEWAQVVKGNSWTNNCPAKLVKCSNGDVSI